MINLGDQERTVKSRLMTPYIRDGQLGPALGIRACRGRPPLGGLRAIQTIFNSEHSP